MRQEYDPNNRTRQNLRKDLNEMELTTLRHKEFKAIVIKMLTGLKRRKDELREDFNKEKICKRTTGSWEKDGSI